MLIKSFRGGEIFGALYYQGNEIPEIKDVKLIALHGWQRSYKDYNNILSDLSYPSVAFDLPGFGLSKEPEIPVGSLGYAKLLAPIIKEFSNPVVVVGHSFGGRVALGLTKLMPEKIKSLMLISTPIYRKSLKKTPGIYKFVKWLKLHSVAPEKLFQWAQQRYSSKDYLNASEMLKKVMIEVLKEETSGFYLDIIKNFTKPIYALWGANDKDTPLEMASYLKNYDHVKVFVDQNSSHLLLIENPDFVKEKLIKLVNENEP